MAEHAETVAVVVVTHNRADLLARMLDALVVQTHPIATVIVVDNASGDHTQQVLARDDLPLQIIVTGHYRDTFHRIDGAWWFDTRIMFVDQVGATSHHLKF